MVFPPLGVPTGPMHFQCPETRPYDQNLENAIEPVLPVEEAEDFGETLKEWRSGTLTDAILQMMFVSGETADPSIETTGMIEEIVRDQVVEMVSDELRNLELPK